jgi:hypothetical protein
MTQISFKEDIYTPPRPKIVPAVGMLVSATILILMVMTITETSLLWKILTGLIGAGAAIAVVVLKRRSWMMNQARPALMRQQVAAAVGQPLPEKLPGQSGKSLVASRFQRGSLMDPGPARRIVIRARHLATLEPMQVEQIADALRRCEGIEYKVTTKKSKPGRFVFTPKPVHTEAELTPREQVEARFTKAAKQVLGEGAQVSFQWDEKEEDFLVGAEITGFNGMDVSLTGKQRQAATRLSSQLPDPQAFKYTVIPQEDRFQFTRSAPLPNLVMPPKVTAEMIRDHQMYKNFEVPLGVGPNGKEAVWRPARDAHLLIIGGTGGGKTICEHGVIQRLTQAVWRTWLIDGKRIEFLGYPEWPNVEFLAQDVDAQIRLIKLAKDTMDARYDLVRDKKVRIEQLDPIVVVIDEVTSLLASLEMRYQDTKVKGMRSKSPILDWLGDIARLGRSAKIHLVFGMQRPDTTIIDGEVRDNFGARISLGKLKSSAGSVMMWDNHAIGCQVPPIPGRAISLIDNHPTMIQATLNANPDPSHDDYHPGIIAAMRPVEEIYTRKTILDAEPQEPEDPEKGAQVTWPDILEAKIVDSTGGEVIFDPVSSEESRQVRSKTAQPRGDAEDQHLQTAETFDEAMNLFPAPPGQQSIDFLDYGKSVAAALIRSLPENFEGQEVQPQPRMEPPRTSLATSTEEPSLMPQYLTTATALEAGEYAEFDQVGEEIMISEVTTTGSGSCVVTGYSSDGEEISLEVPAETEVQARSSAEDDTDLYETEAA